MRPGDVMAFYTDGLTEAIVGPGRTRFDDDGGLESFAARKGPTTAPKIVDDLTSLLASFGDGLQDDVALLAFEAQGASRQLRITAEAKTMAEVVVYVESLRLSPVAQSVVLGSHEVVTQDGVSVIRFSVDVGWGNAS